MIQRSSGSTRFLCYKIAEGSMFWLRSLDLWKAILDKTRKILLQIIWFMTYFLSFQSNLHLQSLPKHRFVPIIKYALLEEEEEGKKKEENLWFPCIIHHEEVSLNGWKKEETLGKYIPSTFITVGFFLCVSVLPKKPKGCSFLQYPCKKCKQSLHPIW